MRLPATTLWMLVGVAVFVGFLFFAGSVAASSPTDALVIRTLMGVFTALVAGVVRGVRGTIR